MPTPVWKSACWIRPVVTTKRHASAKFHLPAFGTKLAKRLRYVLLALIAGSVCAQPPQNTGMNPIADSYVKLVLALGETDSDYVDAYYGPPEWKKEAEESKPPTIEILQSAHHLAEQLEKLPEPKGEQDQLRREYLLKQLSALEARVRLLQGEKMTFD